MLRGFQSEAWRLETQPFVEWQRIAVAESVPFPEYTERVTE